MVPGPRGTLPDVIPEPSSDGTTAPPTGAAADVQGDVPADVRVDVQVEAAADDEAVLDQLEADLTAVEHAISTLDRVTAEGEGGDSAANQIAVAVSDARFGVEPAADGPVADGPAAGEHTAGEHTAGGTTPTG